MSFIESTSDSGVAGEPPVSHSRGTISKSQYFTAAILLLCGVYAYGLTREINEPWVGLHDWNGAFYSQLARNFLRYPIGVHHGMPIVAVGRDVPPESERSLYATHPPALVWLVAGAFQVFGESEWAARLVPIVFSLATFALLLWLFIAAYDGATALFAGLFYAVMPMSVYYGRMVNHEAICLFCMVAASCGWVLAQRRFAAVGASATGALRESAVESKNANGSGRPSIASRDSGEAAGRVSLGWWLPIVAAIWLGVWIDWSVVLYGGLFSIALIVGVFRKRVERGVAFPIIIGAMVAVGAIALFIVYAGLEGRFGDLVAIFMSRSGDGLYVVERSGTGDWSLHVVDNVTRGLLLLAVIGVVLMLAFKSKRRVSGDGAELQTRAATRRGLQLIMLTGVVWVAVFWEQFERHEYWMFYVGPAIAISAGRGLGVIFEIARWSGARVTVYAIVAIALVTAGYEWQGTERLFARAHRPVAEIEDFQAIADLVAPGERIVMYRNPYRVERRGGYAFRNVVPPQLAWYVDRRVTVEREPVKIGELAVNHPVFVIPTRDAAASREMFDELIGSYQLTVLNWHAVVHLNQPRAAVE